MRAGAPCRQSKTSSNRAASLLLSASLTALLTALLAGLLILPTLPAGAQVAEDRASKLFDQHRAAVVQLRVIDLASGDKSSIGSGFQINENGRIVSNYHVVSAYVNAPDRYRLEFLDSTGRRGALTLVDVDVVNDLVLLWTSVPLGGVLELGDSELAQGQRVFSLGNPFDLAMTIGSLIAANMPSVS